MKSQLLRRIAVGAAVMLPLGGMSLIGAQAIGGVQNAGAALPSTLTFASTDVITVAVAGGISVNLSSGSDGHAATGSVTLTSGVSKYAYVVPFTGGSITLPAGNIFGSATDVIFVDDPNATTVSLTLTGYSGCGVTGLTANGIEWTGSSNPLKLTAASSPITGATRTGTCTDSSVLDAQLASGVSISGSISVS